MKNIIQNLTLILFGLIVSLIISDIAIRALGIAPEFARLELGRFRASHNPRIGIEPIPFSKGEDSRPKFNDGYIGIPDNFNSMGFRDREHSVEKNENIRILVLGDSLSMGNFIKNRDDIYLNKVFNILSQYRIEIINFGVSGYNTIQELETLKEKGLQYNPDIVILQYCLNDDHVSDSGRLQKIIDSNNHSSLEFEKIFFPLFKHSSLFRYIYAQYLYTKDSNYQTEINNIKKPDLEKEFLMLKTLSVEKSFHPLVFIFPTRNMYDTNDLNKQNRVMNILKKIGIESYNLLDTFEACSKSGENLWHDLLHPTAKGHECAALYISEILKNKITHIKKHSLQ